MHRKFLRDTLICLVPILIAGYLVTSAYSKFQQGRGGFKLGVDLVGGTILVYEVDPQLTKELRGDGNRPLNLDNDTVGSERGAISSDEMAQLAAALKRRIDPADLRNVTIRPVGRTRIEIVLPTGGQTHSDTKRSDFTVEEVEAIKALIRQVGSLEFRILANDIDDNEALEAASAFITDAANKDVLQRRALDGLPPTFPPGEYSALGEPASYAWVQLGQMERQQMRLDNSQETLNPPGELWKKMSEARAENRTYKLVDEARSRDENLRTSALLYSRPCISRRLNDAERAERKYEYFVLTRASDSVKVGGNVSINATVGSSPDGRVAVDFTFNSVGASEFHRITEKNKPDRKTNVARQLAIILDGMLTSAPRLLAVISDRGQITGNYTHDSAVQLVNILRSGALTAVLKPQPVSENTIGATLGEDTIRSGTLAVGLAFVFVLGFMLFYYRFAGFVASVALLANLVLTVGFMVAVNATFTLPGLAGLVLMLGMAVDANVLIYERLREERDRGANLPVSIRNGYDHAFPTIIDTHLSSIFTAIVLYTVGNDQLKGFGVSLTAGLVISLFTSLFMTRLMFDYWIRRNWLSKLRMLRLFSRPNINFMRIRHAMFAATGILTVLGLGLFLVRGESGLNVDFIGGTAYGGQLSKTNPVTQDGLEIGSLRKLMSEDRQKELLKVASVDPKEDPSGKFKNLFVIHYADGTEQQVSLNNPPVGNTPQEQAESLKVRASTLPDWSVEQIFLAGSSSNRSRYFTVRTTEKEPELVQLAIDRLFRENGNSLLARTTINIQKTGTGWDLTFVDPDSGEPQLTSPSYVKTLIEREFRTSLGDQIGFQEPFSLQGVGEDKDGRFAKMRLEPNEVLAKRPAEVEKILKDAAKTFASRPQPERLETFDSTLASEMRSRALYAILASWLAILLYLWFRFGSWTFGAAAVICLIHDLCFTLGAIALCHYAHDTMVGRILTLQDFKIDLPAVAALLTLVGYSVNDTIVVFDRIREVRGKNPNLTPQMINDSVNQTLSRTVLASLTVFLVVGVLYWFGGEGVHLFAFVMVVGVIVGTYSSIYIASPLLLIFGEGKHHLQQRTTSPEPESATA